MAGSEWFVDQYAMESMEIRVVRDTVSRDELTEFAKQQFGDMTKAVVDLEQGIMAIGGEFHSDEEAVLLDQGSAQRHLWGVNLYSDKPLDEWIEFDSMINVRPSGGNRSRYVENSDIREAPSQGSSTGWWGLARIIHEHFCCNHQYAIATGGFAAQSVNILF